MPTKQAHGINVLALYGDSYLHHEGIGVVTLDDNGQIMSIRCGIFPQQEGLPKVGADCRITGTYDGVQAFTADLKCTQAGRPQSVFTR
jgi:hypothetical protein